ncbi:MULTISPECIES: polyprenyl synthetase family protein [Spirulina sp. CCY15215]|uniref:polyprenyl synthetase family protein n=1 Tax=Spirulina sp. CCY15215 TaxID=2767591 RepID=UPI00194EC03B|nr:polyprenyl synthetase family protein [Spirulina major]
MINKPSLNLDDALVQIRNLAIAIVKQEWLELGALIDRILPAPLNPFFLLSIATGKGCQGKSDRLIHTAALVVLLDLSLRIIDDCADGDNPNSLDQSIGMGRAINYAIALNTLATRELLNCAIANYNSSDLIDCYFSSFLRVCEGQDRDMKQNVNSLQEYQELVRLKTIPAYQFTTVVGAWVASADENAIALSAKSGIHLGWMTQILDDIESLWFPVVENIREVEKKTFPVLLGLTLEHPNAKILAEMFQQKEYNRIKICNLLDEMDVRTRLMNLALDRRDAAIQALADLPDPEGLNILQIWLDWYLRDGQHLVTSTAKGRSQVSR